jgi:hypothetical protein
MESIRTYTGRIFLCTSCGQPCYEDAGETGLGILLQHFQEQWDGIYCERFPLATGKIAIDWGVMSLAGLKQQYPNTHPERAHGATAAPR